MTTVAIEGAYFLVVWGQKVLHLLMGMDTTHNYNAVVLWGMILMPCIYGVFGAFQNFVYGNYIHTPAATVWEMMGMNGLGIKM